MNSTAPAARRIRTALVTTVAAAASVAGVLGMAGAASASPAGHTRGFVVTDSCTSVAGKISYSPGLRKAVLKQVSAVLTGTTSGCSDIFNGALSGSGTFTAVLSGKADLAAENFSGTFTINWPAGSGFNPSNGNLSVTESSGLENISGTITSGFDTGSVIAMQYVTTGNKGTGTKAKPVTSQTYTNTQSLTVSRNEG